MGCAASRARVQPAISGLVFGRQLEEVLENEWRAYPQVPVVVEHCVEFLRARGLEHRGIFRESSARHNIVDLARQYDAGQRVDLFDTIHDPNIVAGLLKHFLRMLPECLLTAEAYDLFIRSNAYSQEERFQQVKDLLTALPEANTSTLLLLLHFFDEIAAKADVNLMDLPNLGRVLAPTLLFKGELDPTEALADLPQVIDAATYVMMRHRELLPEYGAGLPRAAPPPAAAPSRDGEDGAAEGAIAPIASPLPGAAPGRASPPRVAPIPTPGAVALPGLGAHPPLRPAPAKPAPPEPDSDDDARRSPRRVPPGRRPTAGRTLPATPAAASSDDGFAAIAPGPIPTAPHASPPPSPPPAENVHPGELVLADGRPFYSDFGQPARWSCCGEKRASPGCRQLVPRIVHG